MSQDESAVNAEVVEQESTATDSASVETKTPEVADPLLETLSSDDDSPVVETSEEKTKEDAKDEVQADDTATEPEAEQEKPLGKAEERKQQLNAEIRDKVAERNALKAEIERLNAQVYKPQTAEELVEEGYSAEVAEVKALKQELELQNYNARVVEAQTSLSEQASQVLTEFPMFNPDSDEYQEDIARDAAQALEASLIIDPNTNQIVGSHLSPYQIYKPIADAFRKSQLQGQIKGQKATEQMLASVDVRPSVTPKEPKKDPLMEILKSDD